MPLYQNTTVTSAYLTVGNYKIESAAYGTSAGGTWVNLGAGIVNKFGYNVTKYDVQAGNAVDPIEGVADETFTIDAELIEYEASRLAAISGGLLTKSAGTTGVTILKGGGKTDITSRAFKLTNRRLIGSVTSSTVILVYKATLDTGLQFTAKSDNDTDPVNVMPLTITGKLDTSKTAGTQLFSITRTYNNA
jgi:hypothetical protein